MSEAPPDPPPDPRPASGSRPGAHHRSAGKPSPDRSRPRPHRPRAHRSGASRRLRRLRWRLRHAARAAGRRVTRHRVALAISTLAVAVILGGLLAAGFLAPPAGSGVPLPAQRPQSLLRVPALSDVTGSGSSAAKPGHHGHGSRGGGASASSGTGESVGVGSGLTVPYNPLNHLDGTVHKVTITVTADGPIGTFGYLVPTGLTSAEGKPHTAKSSWSLGQLAIGSGKLAAVFLQTDATGRRITCQVRVDGRTTSSETVDRPYARTVCLG